MPIGEVCALQDFVNLYPENTANFEVNRKTVKHWLDKVEVEATLAGEPSVKEAALSTAKKKTKSAGLKQHPSTKVLELEAKVDALEQELEEAKFKALYYSTLVRIAQQDLGIAIEKKYPFCEVPLFLG